MESSTPEDGVEGHGRGAKVLEILSSRSRWALALVLLAAVLMGGVKAWQAYGLASIDKFDTYVSDEVWYVTSARTILYEVLGLEPRYNVNGSLVYTVFTSTSDALEDVRSQVLRLRGIIVKDDYQEVNAIAVGLPPEVDAQTVLGNIRGVVKVIPGYPYADKKNIHNYYNLEHPPLGKYIIGFSMYALGDRPLSWRVPGIVEAGLLVLVAALAGFRLAGLWGGLASLLAAGLDPLTTRMASVAMLDIHLAFFTSLAVLAVVYRKWGLALVFTGLAGMVKYSGFFLLPGLYTALRFSGRSPRQALTTLVASQLVVSALVYLPFALAMGISRLVTEFVNALKWHTTSRPAGPATSTPVEWVLGWNPFYLHLDPDVPARGSPFIYVPVFVVFLLLLPGVFSRSLRRRIGGEASDLLLLLGSFLLGFALVYIMGNRTLYSFYMTQATPLYYALFPVSVLVLAARGWLVGASLSLAREVASAWALGGLGAYNPPRELAFAWKILFWEPVRRRVVFWTIVALTVFSLASHWDVGQDVKLFSDAQWMVWEEGAQRVEPGRMLGLQGLMATLLSAMVLGGNYLLLIDFASLMLFANEMRILVSHLESRGARVRLYFYPMTLTLVMYGIYDGSGLTLFLFTFALNLWLEGKSFPAGLVWGLSAGNPILLFTLPLILALRDRTALGGFALTSLTTSLGLALALGAGDWVASLAHFIDTKRAAGLGLLLPHERLALPLLFTAGLVTSLFAARFSKCPVTSLALGILVMSALFPNILPQWILVLAPLVLVGGLRLLTPLLVVDVLNALVVFLWFSSEEVMKQFFKLETQGPLDPLSAPALASYARSLALLILAIRLYKGRGGSIERC